MIPTASSYRTILTGICVASLCLAGSSVCTTKAPRKESSAQTTKAAAQPAAQPETSMTTQKKVELPSGLAYTIITPGDAAKGVARPGKKVRVHYTGWLTTTGEKGKKFDSSLDRGEPFEFPLGSGWVIKGWEEGVDGMAIGEKRELIIPAALGYGARGAGAVIPPNATLLFEVELLAIK